MALNTQFLLPVHLELVREIGAFWIVAADAGHHLAVSWIDDLGSNRMGKGALAFMTTTAYLVAITFKHGWGIATMGTVAIDTFAALLVSERFTLMPGVCVLMTAQTDLPLGAGKQHPVIASMWTVAANAGIAISIIGQVTMDQIIISLHCLVAREADTGRHRLIPLVTGLTPFLEGGMLHFTQQRL